MSDPIDEMRERLLLIAPPLRGLLRGSPSALIDLANYVSRELPFLDVQILDLSESSLPEIAKRFQSREFADRDRLWVGITATTASYQSALAAARTIKGARPESMVVLGGAHPSADGELILERNPVVDFVVQGEGERSLTALIKRYPDASRVPGLVYRTRKGIRANKPAPRLTGLELDRLPITFRDRGLDANPGKFGTVTYVSARGCPLKCAFCSVADTTTEHKSAGTVVKDLLRLCRRYDFARIAIEDNFFAHRLDRTVDLCERLAELRAEGGLPIRWDCQTRVGSLNRVATREDEFGRTTREPVISLMERAGCEAVYIGVESFVPEHLLYLRKAPSPERYLRRFVESVLPQLLVSKIECYINLQLGIPRETEEHRAITLRVLRQIGQMARRAGRQITVFPQLHVVYPGTAHFAEGVEQGRFPRDVFESFTEWEAHQQPIIRWLGEHFAHGTGGLPEGILDPDRLRDGRFLVRRERVAEIEGILAQMSQVRGVEVFQYGKHLIDDDSSSALLVGSAQVVNTEE